MLKSFVKSKKIKNFRKSLKEIFTNPVKKNNFFKCKINV